MPNAEMTVESGPFPFQPTTNNQPNPPNMKTRIATSLLAAASLAAMLRGAEPVPAGAKLALVLRMSVPAMMAEFASMAMSFIDAAMIGRLGTADAAAVGLMASSTWLFGGVCWAGVVGFSVQIAQAVGAGRETEARSVLRQGLAVLGGLSLALAAAGAAVSPWLPGWLGGKGGTALLAARYFAICMAGVPFLQLGALSTAALQARGDMRTPGSLNMQMCALNVLFNLLLIFPSREWTLPSGFALRLPGAGLGGGRHGAAARPGPARARPGPLAARGRAAAPVAPGRAEGGEALRPGRLRERRDERRRRRGDGGGRPARRRRDRRELLRRHGGGAVLPAVHRHPRGRPDNRRAGGRRRARGRSAELRLSRNGVPHLIGLFTREPDIVREGAAALRAVAFAEPFFAAAIVGGGALRGAGDTLVPGAFNSLSMWCVRLPLAAFLAERHGLRGVWEAIAVELVVRGCFALARLKSSGWSGGATRAGAGSRRRCTCRTRRPGTGRARR